MKNKKGQFDVINTGTIGLVVFALVVVLILSLISVVRDMDLVCPYTISGDRCLYCETNYTVNVTDDICYNITEGAANGGEGKTVFEQNIGAYNATQEMNKAGTIPGQFAEILMVIVVMVGIMSVLVMIGYNVWKRRN